MCGLAGQFRRDGQPVDRGTLQAMTDILAHRGPDDSGLFCEGPIGLGHRRLAIIDLSPAGRQPMFDATSRVAVIYNGEIYNHGKLRDELERRHGVRFRTRSDTEIIPAAYLAWGESCFERFEGMFAIALWDSHEKKLMLARDAAGMKPLWFQWHDRALLFGSEIKAIIAGLPQRPAIDPLAFHRFLAQGYVSPTACYLEGVEQVPPGTSISMTASQETRRRFWAPSRLPSEACLTDAVEEFLPLFRNVCEDHLCSDVPLGILQSGGIDSSLVSLSLAERRLPLFSAGFASQSYDETGAANDVARVAQTNLHRIEIEMQENLPELFCKVVAQVDGQLGDSSALAHYVLSRAVRRHVKVALAGDGADEFFGGYPTYRASRIAALMKPLLPKFLWNFLATVAERFPAGDETRYPLPQLAKRFFSGIAYGRQAHAQWRRLLPQSLIEPLYGPIMTDVAGIDPLGLYIAALAGGDGLVDQCLLADQTYYLPADMLMKADSMSMAHGLELRLPFLDRRVMDFAATLSAKLLSPAGGPDKPVLRAALARLGAPKTVVNRPKTGFNVPVARLLRRDLSGLAECYFEKNPNIFVPYLNADAVRRIWRDHRDRRRDFGYALWAMLTAAVWLSGERGVPNGC